MPAEPTTSRTWRWQTIAVGLSGPALGLLYAFGCPLWLLVPVHLLSGLGAWRLWRLPGPGGRELGLQASTLTLCFPLVGSPCAWLIFGRRGKKDTAVMDAYRSYVAYQHREPLVLRPVDPRARLLREVGVMPLRDQLGQGDIAAKQSAAAALAQLPGNSGVRALRAALTHDADDTRLLASLALLRKEEELVAQLNRVREACKSPKAPASAWCNLAEVARRYAESGLPAPKAAESYWTECERAARQTLSQPSPYAADAWLHVAASRSSRGDWPEALLAAESALAVDPHSTEAVICRCEALFALGRLNALGEAILPLAEIAGLQDVAAYWGAAHAS